jgi:arylsulfatase A-like enzyme
MCQVDFPATFAAFTGVEWDTITGPDSRMMLEPLLGHSAEGRNQLVEHNAQGTLSLIQGDWKYIEPGTGPKINENTNTELGIDSLGQLYNLAEDIGETRNLAAENPEKTREMAVLLEEIKKQPGR